VVLKQRGKEDLKAFSGGKKGKWQHQHRRLKRRRRQRPNSGLSAKKKRSRRRKRRFRKSMSSPPLPHQSDRLTSAYVLQKSLSCRL